MLIPKLIRRVLPLALTPLRPFSQKIYEIAPAVFDEKNAQENMYFQLVPVTPKEAAELLRNGHPVVYDKPPVRRKHYDECASSAGTDKRDSSHKDDILLDYWYFDYLRTKTRKDSDSVTEKKPSSSDDMEDPYSSDQDPVSDFEERTRMKYEAILKSEEEIFNQNLYTPSRSVNFESDSFDREYSPSGRSYSGNGDWGDSGGGSGYWGGSGGGSGDWGGSGGGSGDWGGSGGDSGDWGGSDD